MPLPPPTDEPEQLVGVMATNLIGHLRGKMIPLADIDERLDGGVGWTPANVAIDPFGAIPADNPYGSRGDTTMRPDVASEVHVGGLLQPPLHYYLADIYDATGQRWPSCPRGALTVALEDLHAVTGLTLRASFEHEFMLLGAPLPPSGYTLERVRAAEPFPSRLTAALNEAGCEPETVLSEYGADQFEVTCRPTGALQAADRAHAVRQITREVARACGWRATFTPLVAPDAVGNGVHIHLSLYDGDTPVTCDPDRFHGLSAPATAFVAGLLAHAPAVCALTAPSPVSYGRLRPGRWSVGRTVCDSADREVLVRIPAPAPLGADTPRDSFNFEFRAVDATATPHLALAALVRAGLDGIRDGLSLGPRPDGAIAITGAGDPLPTELPSSLGEALDAFETDPATPGWFSDQLRAGFVSLKRHELNAYAADTNLAGICTRYADVY